MVRYKNRYLLLEWKFSSQTVGHNTLKGESTKNIVSFVRERIQYYHGDYGVACVDQSLSVKYHNVSTLMTILRCPRAHYKAVWSALSGITTFKKEPCSLSVVHLAGTIRSVQQALVQRNLALLKKELAMTTLPVEREKIERKWREIKKSLQDLARW